MTTNATGNGNDSEALLLTVREAASLLHISRNLCYELVAQGRIPHIRLGRAIRIPRHGLETWIAQEAGLPVPPPGVDARGKTHRLRAMGKPAVGGKVD